MRIVLLVVLALACGDDSTIVDASRADATSPDVGLSDTGVDAPSDDAPTLDVPGIDAPATDTGEERCASALFCEDFEDVAAGEAMSDRWETRGNGTLTIDGEHARGSQALHVHTDENGFAFLRLDFAPPDNSHFGRMWIWVTGFPSAPDWAHYTLVEARGESSDRIRPVGGQFAPIDPAGAYWGIGADGGATGDWTNWRTSEPSVAGEWVCVEWEMDASDNFIRLMFNGEPNEDLVVDTDDHGGNDVDFVFPDFTTLDIGWQLYQGGPTPDQFDLWIDDIVLDTTAVGCE